MTDLERKKERTGLKEKNGFYQRKIGLLEKDGFKGEGRIKRERRISTDGTGLKDKD